MRCLRENNQIRRCRISGVHLMNSRSAVAESSKTEGFRYTTFVGFVLRDGDNRPIATVADYCHSCGVFDELTASGVGAQATGTTADKASQQTISLLQPQQPWRSHIHIHSTCCTGCGRYSPRTGRTGLPGAIQNAVR